ncbi:hypothetical protein MD588_19020 [Photobacterium sp. SDRW27]|uniref:hypothetical protein n=1 Tax=Photobacterium obscurum TaxID=2829490 RepID=UPI002243C436|nr:hypothetical protein [Photobacterium obscurum]MCW8330889.1 hypothetical protein [Photobacterium obscurum]
MNIYSQQIPKQVTKAPAGAAVSSMPLHEVAIPLEKSVTAQYMADHARDEFHRSLRLAKQLRLEGDRGQAAFMLNDAGEFRRIHREFTLAVELMGGL